MAQGAVGERIGSLFSKIYCGPNVFVLGFQLFTADSILLVQNKQIQANDLKLTQAIRKNVNKKDTFAPRANHKFPLQLESWSATHSVHSKISQSSLDTVNCVTNWNRLCLLTHTSKIPPNLPQNHQRKY